MSRIGETFACARCGQPVVRKGPLQKYCAACGAAAHREKLTERNRCMKGQGRANYRWNLEWANRRAAERRAAMLRTERLLSEIGRDRPSRVYVWRDCVVEWRGTAPSF